MFEDLWKFTKYGFRIPLLLILLIFPAVSQANSFEEILRKAAFDNGIRPTDKLFDPRDQELSSVGEKFFKSKALSLNDQISCQTCHLKEFSSADGLPNAVGLGGEGKGNQRIKNLGKIIPRNTLPFWGVGGLGFTTFFWDGKVDFSGNAKISPFGDQMPSSDPLAIAVHLPAVEIGEMLNEDQVVSKHKKETVESGSKIYGLIIENLSESENSAISTLSKLLKKQEDQITFADIARSIAAFIRAEFRLRPTKFHNFIFKKASLTADELRGGVLFYGKGKCSNCHDGPYFSDFKFHAISFPQLGFGKNGFGVDYGRFNVTLNPDDLYKFRTPPLYNVAKTTPYGHSGSVKSLSNAIKFHFDPLEILNTKAMEPLERHEYYKRLAISSKNILYISYLTDEEINLLEKFLHTLNIKEK